MAEDPIEQRPLRRGGRAQVQEEVAGQSADKSRAFSQPTPLPDQTKQSIDHDPVLQAVRRASLQSDGGQGEVLAHEAVAKQILSQSSAGTPIGQQNSQTE
eukprot:scaffold9386_cov154-Ochromonas_danica.AAC.1